MKKTLIGGLIGGGYSLLFMGIVFLTDSSGLNLSFIDSLFGQILKVLFYPLIFIIDYLTQKVTDLYLFILILIISIIIGSLIGLIFDNTKIKKKTRK